MQVVVVVLAMRKLASLADLEALEEEVVQTIMRLAHQEPQTLAVAAAQGHTTQVVLFFMLVEMVEVVL
jgi:hypothetical protein